MKHRSNCTRHRKSIPGFTLIELLVVIAIIALLLSIIMPALRVAKDHAKKIHCSANLKSLTIAALLYADEHDSYTPSATNYWNDNGTTLPGWCGRTGNGANLFTETEQIASLENGQLWPYIETPDAWRCPADPLKESLRSYCMAAQWWSVHYRENLDAVFYDPVFTKGKVFKTITKIPNAGQRFLFVDNVGYNSDAYSAIWGSKATWWNIPSFYHSGGAVNGYTDGHVEGFKLDPETVAVAKKRLEEIQSSGQTNGYKMPQNRVYHTEDLKYYQRATWGELGWTP